jgi:hypothetical protein
MAQQLYPFLEANGITTELLPRLSNNDHLHGNQNGAKHNVNTQQILLINHIDTVAVLGTRLCCKTSNEGSNA